MRSILRYALILCLLSACHPDRPGYVISEGKMERILYDYHLAQAMSEVQRDSADYYRYAFVHKVFEKHGITEAEFDTSMIWYSANASELYKIYTHLNERLEAEAAAAGVSQTRDVFASLTATGDTANIWMDGNMLVMQQATHTNHSTFSYAADTTFRRGDEFILHGKTYFMQSDGAREAIAALIIRHSGDSVLSQTRYIRSDSEFDIHLTADQHLDIEQVSGFFYYPTTDNRDNKARRLFILNPVLVRIHHAPLPVDTVAVDTLAIEGRDSIVVDTSLVSTQTTIETAKIDEPNRLPSRRPARRPHNR